MKRASSQKAILATVLCHTFWGVSFLASRLALDRAHVFVLLSHRFLIAFLTMTVVAVVRRIRFRPQGRRTLLLVLLGVAQPVLYFFGEQYGLLHSTTIFSGVMIAMIPIVSMLAAAPILKERPTGGQLLFGVVSVGGVIGIGLMSNHSGTLDAIGVCCLLLAIVSAAAYTLISRGVSAEFSPFERTYTMLAVGAAVFTVAAGVAVKGDIVRYLHPLRDPSYLLPVLFLSLFCSVLGFFLSSYALTNLSVARETVFSNLTTAVSVFAGEVFLDEPFTWGGVVCTLLILIGIWGVQRTSRESGAASKKEQPKARERI